MNIKMVYSLLIALGMGVGALFAIQVVKTMKADAGLAGMALMILWDAIWVYMITDYASKKELAIGIMLGTVIKVLILIKKQL